MEIPDGELFNDFNNFNDVWRAERDKSGNSYLFEIKEVFPWLLEKEARKGPAKKLAISLVSKYEMDHNEPMTAKIKLECVAQIREKLGVSYKQAYNAVYRATNSGK